MNDQHNPQGQNSQMPPLPNSTEFNPYSVPKADVAPPPFQVGQIFYIVSLKKMVILNFATLGFYTVYWFWKH